MQFATATSCQYAISRSVTPEQDVFLQLATKKQRICLGLTTKSNNGSLPLLKMRVFSLITHECFYHSSTVELCLWPCAQSAQTPHSSLTWIWILHSTEITTKRSLEIRQKHTLCARHAMPIRTLEAYYRQQSVVLSTNSVEVLQGSHRRSSFWRTQLGISILLRSRDASFYQVTKSFASIMRQSQAVARVPGLRETVREAA